MYIYICGNTVLLTLVLYQRFYVNLSKRRVITCEWHAAVMKWDWKYFFSYSEDRFMFRWEFIYLQFPFRFWKCFFFFFWSRLLSDSDITLFTRMSSCVDRIMVLSRKLLTLISIHWDSRGSEDTRRDNLLQTCFYNFS